MKLLTSLLLVGGTLRVADSFTPKKASSSCQSTVSPLWAKGIKRGKLGKAVGTSTTTTSSSSSSSSSSNEPTKSGSSSVRKAANPKSSGGTVSPALAEWASSGSDRMSERTVTSDSIAESSTFVSFDKDEKTSKRIKKGASSRRVKQSVRQQEEQEREEAVLRVLDELNQLLGSDMSEDKEKQTKRKQKTTVSDIVNTIRPLVDLNTQSLRLVTAGAKPLSYRLAWVGSDDALTHIGTGLHKIPLARMQEVFLTCQGRNRVELLEVIRILGPFPNVRNTLQGDSTVSAQISSSGDDDDTTVSQWDIVMESMVDGTGKEILAGTDDNIRRVGLQVYFADTNAILAVVPPADDPESNVSSSGASRADPFEDNGTHALLFVREEDLQAKLEQLRVN